MGSNPTIYLFTNVYLHLYFHFFALVSRQRAALSSTQHAMLRNLAESGERSVLTLPLPTYNRVILPTLCRYATLCTGFSVKMIYLFFIGRSTHILVVQQHIYWMKCNGYFLWSINVYTRKLVPTAIDWRQVTIITSSCIS